MFLTHIRAAGFVLQECIESFLLQSQDAQSSPEKEGIVASGCSKCCFSPSVPREIPCAEAGASPSRMVPTAVNPRDLGGAGGTAVPFPAADRREHPNPREAQGSGSQRRGTSQGQILPREPFPGAGDKCHSCPGVPTAGTRRFQQLLGPMGAVPAGMPKPVEKQRSG